MARIDDATRQRVVELYKQGLGVCEIGRRVGLSHTSVRNVAQAAGVYDPNRGLSDNSDAGDNRDQLARDAQALTQHGFTVEQTAQELGVSADHVRELLGGLPAEWSCRTCGHAAVCRYSEEAERHRDWAICRHWVARAG